MRTQLRGYRHRLLGVCFLLVIAILLACSMAYYSGAFKSTVPVTLRLETSGNQLRPGADVRFHGYELGTVEKLTSTGTVAVVHLDLDPKATDLVPANTRARVLPKTLIGQNYVDLVMPARPSEKRIGAGDVITKDRSSTAVKLESALNNLLAVLHAVPPQQVASTLNAVSGALQGRGEQLGRTLRTLETYVSGLNPAIPALQSDLRKLAELSDTYSKAAPDLLAGLDNLTATARTVMQRQSDLETLYSTLTATARQSERFLDANGENIIELASAARPTLELLARYAPQYPCLLRQLADLVPKVNDVFGVGTKKPAVAVHVELTNTRGRYEPGQDEPVYNDHRGPRCYPVMAKAPQYPPQGPLRDGATHPPAPENRTNGGLLPMLSPAPNGADMGLPNSRRERKFIAGLLGTGGPSAGPAPKWSSLLAGPLLRGSEVKTR